MGTWYRTGTVSVTNGSKTVSGVGTQWVENAVPGSILKTADGMFEVDQVASAVSITLVENYTGATASGLAYAIIPTQGYIPPLSRKVNELVEQTGAVKDAFANGELLTSGALEGTGGADKVGTADGRTVQDRLNDLPTEVDAAGTAQSKVASHNADANAHPAMTELVTTEANRAKSEADRAAISEQSAFEASGLFVSLSAFGAAVADNKMGGVDSVDPNIAYAIAKKVAGTPYLTGKAVPSKSFVDSVADAQQLKADIAPGKNLFNPSDSGVQIGYAIDGSPSGAGNPFAVGGFRATPFIKVLPNTPYSVSHLRGYAWYDASKQYISGAGPGGSSAPAPLGNSPVNAAYFRTGISDGNLPTFQFEKGVAPTPYEAYKVTLTSPLAANSVSTATLADASVAPAKTSFLQPGKNLFNKAKATIGSFIGNDGTVGSSGSYEVSDFIPVSNASFAYSTSAGLGVRFTTYYDANKAVVVGGSSFPSGSASGNFTPPAGVAFVRISIYQTGHNTFQFEAGSTPTSFEAYNYALRMADGTPIVTASSADPEVGVARGSRAALNDRMSVMLDPYGNSLRYYTGEHYLRKTRRKLASLRDGVGVALVWAGLSDSWLHYAPRYARKLVKAMQAKYGDGGPGWCGFGYPESGLANINGSVSQFLVPTLTGGWAGAYFTSTSPDLCHASSSTVGDTASVAWSGSGNITSVKLHYLTGGAVRYRWNGGSWTALDLSSGTVATLAGVPTGAWTLNIEIVSGAPRLAGIDARKGNGFVFHKLGATGANASMIANMSAPNKVLWQAGITALGLDGAFTSYGTNDQYGQTAPTVFAGQIGTIFDLLRGATPYLDLMHYAPAENGKGRTPTMRDYALAVHQLCSEKKTAFLDSQYVFGDTWAEYSSLFDPVDLIHPTDTGGYVLADALYRMLDSV